jgi:hypothetical protein
MFWFLALRPVENSVVITATVICFVCFLIEVILAGVFGNGSICLNAFYNGNISTFCNADLWVALSVISALFWLAAGCVGVWLILIRNRKSSN